MTWQAEGACVGMPVDIWFEPIPSYESRARFVCAMCPVVARCLNEAVANGDRGMRGGLTWEQRRADVPVELRYRPVVHEVHDMTVAMKGRRVA